MRNPLRSLVIGSVDIPLQAALNLDQQYTDRERSSLIPMGDNSIVKRTYAGSTGKLDGTISGSGTIPPGLQMQSYALPVLIKCIQHRAVTSSNRIIALPAGAYRTDSGSEPYGRAYFKDAHRWVDAPVIDNTNDVVTLTDIAGADAYQVVYFPAIMAYVELPPTERRGRGNNSSWQLNFSEA